MSDSTAYQALCALFGTLVPGQELYFVYQGGVEDGRLEFSFRIYGKARSDKKSIAIQAAERLRQNVELVLSARTELCFGKKSNNNLDLSLTWKSNLYPCGVLVSTGKNVVGVNNPGNPPATLSIRPWLPKIPILSIVDVMLTSPKIIKVVVSIKHRSLSTTDQRILKDILLAIPNQKVDYFILPDRRKPNDEERKVLIEPLEKHLTRWIVTPSGVELHCAIHASSRPSEVFLSMLGKAIFPHESTVVEEESEIYFGDVNLRCCINASSNIPLFFPKPKQLIDIGVKRYYMPPRDEPALQGLRLGIAGGREACLSLNDRSRHAYIIGATGCGKSTLIYNMIQQDIAAGEGVCLMDPHGDLYEELLESIPNERSKDVVLINPCDFGHAVGINFLETTSKHRQIEIGFIVNEMIRIFDRLYDLNRTGGPIFEQYMRNALFLVMDNTSVGTLVDVIRVFEDKNYRESLKKTCKNHSIVNFWKLQAEIAEGDLALPNLAPYITSKLNQFTSNPLLRPIISQHHGTINFREIIDNKRILLVNLSKGLLGELDSQLLGMILIGKLSIAVTGRADVEKSRRVPFNWYIDEFQNFATDSISNLLSESRKYGITITLANQNMAQLHSHRWGESLAQAVLSNVANLLMFRMGVDDAQKMVAYTRPELSAQDLQYLPDFHAVARLLKNNMPLRPFVLKTFPAQLGCFAERAKKEEILEYCRKHYMRPVEEIENENNMTQQKIEEPPKKSSPNHCTMNELMDLVDEYDQVIRPVQRSFIYEKELSNFRVVNLFIENSEGKLWIPRRSRNKVLFPSALDTSVGGHVQSGESYESAMLREMKEEIRIEPLPNQLQCVGYLMPHVHYVSSFMKVFKFYMNSDPTPNPEDIEDWYWLTPQQIILRIKAGDTSKGDLPKLVELFYKL